MDWLTCQLVPNYWEHPQTLIRVKYEIISTGIKIILIANYSIKCSFFIFMMDLEYYWNIWLILIQLIKLKYAIKTIDYFTFHSENSHNYDRNNYIRMEFAIFTILYFLMIINNLKYYFISYFRCLKKIKTLKWYLTTK